MQIEHYGPDDFTVQSGLRPLDTAAVKRLASSIASLGLQNPVTARWVECENGPDLVLVAGRHRLAAAAMLGLPTVPCRILDMNDFEARLWEIAENLHRHELTVQERADHIAEWVRLTDEKLAQSAPVSGGRGNEGGVRAAARELGIDRTEAQRAVKIASITPEARQAADSAGLTTQKARLEIASAPAAEQIQRVAEVAANRTKPVPVPLNDIETEDQWRLAMMRLWNRAPDQWREGFIDYVQSPVFDNTRAAS